MVRGKLHQFRIKRRVHLPDVEQVGIDLMGHARLSSPDFSHHLDELGRVSARETIPIVLTSTNCACVHIPRNPARLYIAQAILSVQRHFLQKGLENGFILEDFFDEVAGREVLLRVYTAVGAGGECKAAGTQSARSALETLAESSSSGGNIGLRSEPVKLGAVVSEAYEELYPLFFSQPFLPACRTGWTDRISASLWRIGEWGARVTRAGHPNQSAYEMRQEARIMRCDGSGRVVSGCLWCAG